MWSSASTRRLVLWDIDGTLVDTAGHGRRAFGEAFEAVVGRPPAEGLVPMAGRTDLGIALALLESNGVEASDGRLAAFADALAGALAARDGRMRAEGRELPGAREALAALARREGVVQSLLTGNIAPNAVRKLAAFGLGDELDFEIGAYGSDHRMRPELVTVARRKASAKDGVDYRPAETVLLGDTPLDVAAGREAGARVVGVASGPFDAGDLERAGADAVLPDLRDTAAVVAAALNRR